jgi:hypothetical protein
MLFAVLLTNKTRLMTLSSDELEILNYLKSWDGKFVSMIEICRCASSRKKFRESPHWAKPLMARLVEGTIVEVNERGHYRCPVKTEAAAPVHKTPQASKTAVIVGDDYFPATVENPEAEAERWVSPQIAAILKKAGKKVGGPAHG